jgi:hypothetical protein
MTVDVLYEGLMVASGAIAREEGDALFVELEAPMPVGARLLLRMSGGLDREARVERVREGAGAGVLLRLLSPPKAEPKIEPKAEPKVEPKAEPKVEPKAESQPSPPSEPPAPVEPKASDGAPKNGDGDHDDGGPDKRGRGGRRRRTRTAIGH